MADSAAMPQVGDHLVSKRRLYTHHGIYVGSGQVVHYSGLAQGLQSGPVCISSFEDFLMGNGYSVRPYSNPKYSGGAIARRALSRCGERLYHPLFNNCEHFAEWCITGHHTSTQVDRYLTLLGGVGGLLLSKSGAGIASLIHKARTRLRRSRSSSTDS